MTAQRRKFELAINLSNAKRDLEAAIDLLRGPDEDIWPAVEACKDSLHQSLGGVEVLEALSFVSQ